MTAEEIVSIFKPGQRVFVHGGAATHFLLKKIDERASSPWNVEIVSISLQGDVAIADRQYKDNFLIAKALIDIAHPNHREKLEREAFERSHTYEFERTI